MLFVDRIKTCSILCAPYKKDSLRNFFILISFTFGFVKGSNKKLSGYWMPWEKKTISSLCENRII